MTDPVKDFPFQEIAKRGEEIYGRIKANYESKEKGRFLAIETESEKEYLGNTSAEALEKARSENPNKVFYVVKVGFDSAETLSQYILGRA